MEKDGRTGLLLLPGQGCRHWLEERCLYEEALNPGWQAGFRCFVLRRWEQDFDEYVSRAECFGLTTEEAGDIWQQRMSSSFGKPWDCPDFLLDNATPDPVCALLLGDICLLRLPPCPGRCRHYER